MDTAALAGLFGIGSASIGAASALLTAWITSHAQRRRESGTVQTSDAQTLFSASNQLIQMLLSSTQSLTQQLDTLTGRLESLMRQIDRIVQQQEELLRLQREQTQTLRRIEGNGVASPGERVGTWNPD